MRWQKIPRLLIGLLAIALLSSACAALKPPEPAADSGAQDGWVRKSHEEPVRQAYPQWPKDW